MSLVTASAVLASVYEEQPLPVPSVVFPIIAISVFILLGFVTWSYRDVANRHATRKQSPGAGAGH